jgi:predicted CoA-binding protein
VVDCFRKSEDIPPVAKDAIDVRAGTLWMQLGIENRMAADLARAAGLDVVMNHCMLVEHRKMVAEAS